MLITFTSAQQTTFSRDGLDMLYFYRRSDLEQVHKIHVVGSNNSWNMSAQEKLDYAQLLFTGAVSYIRNYWARHGELPDNDKEVHDRLDFDTQPNQKTAWEGYKINLE